MIENNAAIFMIRKDDLGILDFMQFLRLKEIHI